MRWMFWRREVKVSLSCKHGDRLAGVWNPRKDFMAVYGCDYCDLLVVLENDRKRQKEPRINY